MSLIKQNKHVFLSAEPQHFGPKKGDKNGINLNELPSDIKKAIKKLKNGLEFTLYINDEYRVYEKWENKFRDVITDHIYMIDDINLILKNIYKN